jgi:hypothetical protein
VYLNLLIIIIRNNVSTSRSKVAHDVKEALQLLQKHKSHKQEKKSKKEKKHKKEHKSSDDAKKRTKN